MELKEVRLLHIFKSLDIGGVQKSTIIYSNNLLKDVAFIGIFAKKGIYNHSNLVDREIELLHPPFDFELNALSYPLYFIQVARSIVQFRINVIVYHHRIFAPLIWLLRLFSPRVRIIHTAHTSFDDFKNLFITADSYVAVSDAVRKDLERYDKTNIRVLLHGVESTEMVRRSHNNTTIGYVGRFEGLKGLPILLKAFQLLMVKKRNYKLILRGDGPSKNEIIQLLSDLKINDDVVIDSPKILEDDIYRSIDILVLPSLRLEGFGLVLIEAMREGIPVVASSVAGISEVIRNDHNGKLVKPGNATELADAIDNLLRNKNQYEYFSRNGIETVKSKYSLQRLLSQYRQILLNL